MIKLYGFAFSTNVERAQLALAHKGLKVEFISIDPRDRAEIRRVSGQDLVPVIVDKGDDRGDGGKVVFDSMEIVRYLEDRYPSNPLYPSDAARYSEMLIFIDWFNRVWKRPPNDMEAELSKPEGQRDMRRVERLGRAMQGYLDLFEQMLTGRDYLLGDFSAADIAAFPFLKYATLHDPGDPHLFHKILVDYQKPGNSHPNVASWIARVDKRPRV